ncbi:exonuclease SbcCD subunit D [Bacillus daqingensis]|uniref:Nuclease SbcCD subunit D n=1 Tax=Bacillus daqingensis TaxID=872396 RepID=A0ABV9NRC0_9BACI
MRILHTADWHIGRTIEGRDRINEHEAMMEELQRICRDETIDAVVMAGDVFDSVNPPARGEMLYYDGMEALSDGGRRPVIVAAGNHDSPERLEATSSIMKRLNVHTRAFPGIEPVSVQTERGLLQAVVMPYPSEARLKRRLSDELNEFDLREQYDQAVSGLYQTQLRQLDPRAPIIGVSHLFAAGGAETDSERPIQLGGAYTVRGASLPAVDYHALGHLHRSQAVKTAPAPSCYSGSPMGFSFSERADIKSVSIVTLGEEDSPKVKTVPLSCGKPLVRWKAEAGAQQVLQWMDEKRDAGSWLEIEVHTDQPLSAETVHHMKKAYNGLLSIIPIFPDRDRDVEIRRRERPIEDLFTEFYKKQLDGAEPSAELKELFLRMVEVEDHEAAQTDD